MVRFHIKLIDKVAAVVVEIAFNFKQPEALVAELQRLNKTVDYHLIDSDYGHDSFLVEPEKYIPLLKEFLNTLDTGRV